MMRNATLLLAMLLLVASLLAWPGVTVLLAVLPMAPGLWERQWKAASAWGALLALAGIGGVVWHAGLPLFVDGHEAGWLALLLAGWMLSAVATARLGAAGFAGKLASVPLLLGMVLATSAAFHAIGPVTMTSRHVQMRDGVRIAVDVYLPRTAHDGQIRLPVLMKQTRYFRSVELAWPFSALASPVPSLARELVDAGYGYLVADVRGSGASFGTRSSEWSDDEVHDGREIMDWIVRQPWSDGRIGGFGISYAGTTAEFSASTGHPALKAIGVNFALYDAYTDITWPGGIFADRFVSQWGRANAALDGNDVSRSTRSMLRRWMVRGVRPVDGPEGRRLLREAIAAHSRNYDIHAAAGAAQYRDQGYGGGSYVSSSPYRYRDRIRASGVAVHGISGWYDGGYAAATLRRFLTVGGAGSRITLGPWAHGGAAAISPCRDVDGAKPLDYPGETIGFFDQALKSGHSPGAAPIRYFMMCGDGWHEADRWPPAGSIVEHHALLPGRRLSASSDRHAGPESVPYAVGPSATQGTGTRWRSVFNPDGTPIGYPDLARMNETALVHTGEPVAEDLDIVGSPVLHLRMATSRTDGQVFAMLQDVAPDGRITYVTDGQLRLLHRRVAEPGDLPYAMLGGEHTYMRAHARPMSPGVVEDVVIGLLPVAYRVRKGHRIALALTGANVDEFRPLSIGQGEEWAIQVGGGEKDGSWLALPVLTSGVDAESTSRVE